MTRRCAPACCRSPYCAVRKIGGSPPGTAQSGGEPDEGRRPAPLGRVPTPQAWVRGEQCSHYSALRSTAASNPLRTCSWKVVSEPTSLIPVPPQTATAPSAAPQEPASAPRGGPRAGCAAGRGLPPGPHPRHGDLSRLPSSALPRASVSPYPRFPDSPVPLVVAPSTRRSPPGSRLIAAIPVPVRNLGSWLSSLCGHSAFRNPH